MSIGDWFRRLLSGPSETAERDADTHEEYGTPNEGEAMAETGGAAEAAEAELESEEAPPDPAP